MEDLIKQEVGSGSSVLPGDRTLGQPFHSFPIAAAVVSESAC